MRLARLAVPAALAAATLIAVGGLIAVQDAIAPPDPGVSGAPSATAPRLKWPADTVWRYSLELKGDKRIEAGPATVEGALDLAAHVELRSYGRVDGNTRLGLSFVEVERHGLTMLGEDVMPDRAAADAVFAGHEALLEVAHDGAVVGLRFGADAPTLFQHLARLVAGEIQLVLQPGESTWEAQEKTQHGVALTDYEVIGADAQTVELGRHRFDYARLDGAPTDAATRVEARYTARIDRAGHVRRLQGTETINAGEMGHGQAVRIEGAIDFELLTMGPAPRDGRDPVAALGARTTLDQWPVSAEAKRMMRIRRAGDMTVDRIAADLKAFGPGGQMPEHSKWAWQATGRLLLDPSAATELARIADDERIGHRGRALVLDLLASVGHAEAQAALRDVLEANRGDRRHAALLTRAGFIANPEPATVRLVADTWSRAAGIEKQSAATVLGAAAGHLYRNGETDLALTHVRRIEGALRTAGDTADRRALVLALGNAGVPETVETVAAYARDSDPAIRRAAATALRKTPGAVAEQALGSLMRDADPRVARTAVAALSKHPLDAGHLRSLAGAVADGTLGPATHSQLVELLVSHGDLDTGARRLLATAIATRTTNGKLRGRLARL